MITSWLNFGIFNRPKKNFKTPHSLSVGIGGDKTFTSRCSGPSGQSNFEPCQSCNHRSRRLFQETVELLSAKSIAEIKGQHSVKRRGFTAALIPRLFGNSIPGHTTRVPPVCKRIRGRIGTVVQRHPVLCHTFGGSGAQAQTQSAPSRLQSPGRDGLSLERSTATLAI